MHQRLRTLSLALFPLLLVASACDDDDEDVIGPEPTLEGSYRLGSLNGSPMPYVMELESGELEITTWDLVLSADGTCSTTASLRITTGGEVTSETETDTCTWTRSSNAVQLTWSDGSVDAASWANDQLTLTDETLELIPLEEPLSLVFDRQ